MAALRLLQFEFSHFNEKARWILDYKRLPYEKRSLLPGFHIPTVMAKSGQKATPVLIAGDRVIPGTDVIAAFAEEHGDGPPLYPEDAAERERALVFEKRFEEVGHATRRMFFAELFTDSKTALDCMKGTATGVRASVYAASFPALKHAILMDAGANDPGRVTEARAIVEQALDDLAKEAGPHRHIIGDRFTIADLTAASLLVPLVKTPHAQIPFPKDREVLERWFARYDAHPAAGWVRRMFARYRDTDGGRAE